MECALPEKPGDELHYMNWQGKKNRLKKMSQTLNSVWLNLLKVVSKRMSPNIFLTVLRCLA